MWYYWYTYIMILFADAYHSTVPVLYQYQNYIDDDLLRYSEVLPYHTITINDYLYSRMVFSLGFSSIRFLILNEQCHIYVRDSHWDLCLKTDKFGTSTVRLAPNSTE